MINISKMPLSPKISLSVWTKLVQNDGDGEDFVDSDFLRLGLDRIDISVLPNVQDVPMHVWLIMRLVAVL